MILTGSAIRREQKVGNINIIPFNDERVNPNSYNVSLADELLSYENVPVLDMYGEHADPERIKIPSSGLELKPNTLYLGRTNEKTITRKYAPMLSGRSSIGRLGLSIHVTAGFGDVGFNGYWTLELFTIQPLVIYPNVEIGQVYFYSLLGDTDITYKGKYQNNADIQESKLFIDLEKK